ncbi:MAG: glycosyltransferase [Elusimicrobiota bacterium]
MTYLTLIGAWLVFLIVCGAALEYFWGIRSIGFLKHVLPTESNYPRISIIIPARNEETHIEEALKSVLSLDYPALEIMVINDRSTDKTGVILEKMAHQNSSLKVIHITDLPQNWLGKNHALFFGAQKANGEFLLFADADIIMEPSLLKKAITYVQSEKTDHLTLFPDVKMPGFWLNLFTVGFSIFLCLFLKPWRANNPKSKAFIGIGAFNLIRKSIYEKIGTHEKIRLRPDDDIMLGKLVKKNNFKQNVLFGTDLLCVEWYSSIKELINGLMKNSFSGVNYKLWLLTLGSLAHIILIIWPFIAVFITTGRSLILYQLTILFLVMVGAQQALLNKKNIFYGFGLPLASIMFLYIIWKAGLKTLRQGGIFWRDTFYSLDELKKNNI